MAFRKSPMDPGERDRRITLEQRPVEDTADTSGVPIDGPWTTLASDVPAAKSGISGYERFKADQLSARADVRFEIGWREDMDPNTLDVPKLRRIVHDGRTYDITSGDEIGRRDGIELMAMARVG